jgi:hypothetical protein
VHAHCREEGGQGGQEGRGAWYQSFRVFLGMLLRLWHTVTDLTIFGRWFGKFLIHMAGLWGVPMIRRTL